jgi:hypothetical protein
MTVESWADLKAVKWVGQMVYFVAVWWVAKKADSGAAAMVSSKVAKSVE